MITQSLSELNSFRINTVIYTYDTVKFLFTLVIKHQFFYGETIRMGNKYDLPH